MTFRAIARFMDEDHPPLGMRALLNRFSWHHGTIPSFREIACRHHNGTQLKILSFNTFLMPDMVVLQTAKPDVKHRSLELGPTLRNEGYDVAALSEVWDQVTGTSGIHQTFKLNILHAWEWNREVDDDWPAPINQLNQRYARGPGPADLKTDSGLLTICVNPNFKIVTRVTSTKVQAADSHDLWVWDCWSESASWISQPSTEEESYYRELSGADKSSEKGILLTCIDVGLGE